MLAEGQKYSLEKPEQISVRLKVDHLIFVTLNIHMFVSKFVEVVANPYDSELRWLTQYCIFYISGK